MKKRLLIISLAIIAIILVIFFVVRGCSNKQTSNTSLNMFIEHLYNNDNGVYVVGKKNNNKIEVNDKVEIVGNNKLINTTIKQVITDDSSNSLTLKVENVDINKIKRGMVIATPGKVKEAQEIEIEVTVDKNSEDVINDKSVLVFDIGTENYAGTVKSDATVVRTQTAKIIVTLDDKAPVYVGCEVSVSVNGQKEFAKGKITKVIR